MAFLGRDRTAVYPWLVVVPLVAAWLLSVMLGEGGKDRAGATIGPDFTAFYTAATAVLADPAASIYDPAFLAPLQLALVSDGTSTVVPFLNPPNSLLLYIPFGLFPHRMALALWWAMGVGAWLGAHRVLRRSLKGLNEWHLRDMIVGSLLFPASLLWVMYAQATGLCLLVLALSFSQLLRGREFGAGILLGLLAFKPQLALGLALPVLAGRRWRAIAGGVLSVGVQLGLASVLWPAQWENFFAARADIARLLLRPEYKTWGVQSVYVFWHLLIGGWSAPIADALTVVTTAWCGGVLALVWWHAPWTPGRPRWLVAIAATQVMALLLGMHCYLYDLALLVFPFWVVVSVIHARPRSEPALDGGPVLVWTSALYVLCFVGPYLTLAMTSASATLGLPRMGLQLVVPALIANALWLLRYRDTFPAAEG